MYRLLVQFPGIRVGFIRSGLWESGVESKRFGLCREAMLPTNKGKRRAVF